MTVSEIHARLLERFGPSVILDLKTETRDPWIEVAPAAMAEVAAYLRSDPDLRFDALNDLCGVDYLELDPKKKVTYEPHLEVVYHLYSYPHRHWCKVKVKLPRWRNGVAGALPELPTVSDVWSIADWHEREAYDLVGVRFLGHPNPRRILCPEDWVGHPLRKDYEFPLEYHGIRSR